MILPVLRFISAIYLIIIVYSNTESDYNITKAVNHTTTNQLIFDLYPDNNLDSDFDHFIPKKITQNQLIQLTYLAKYTSIENTSLAKNKYQYLRPRAPPLS